MIYSELIILNTKITLNMVLDSSTQENLSSGVANNTDEYQPAHTHSRVSSFVIHVLESTISKLATSEISFF